MHNWHVAELRSLEDFFLTLLKDQRIVPFLVSYAWLSGTNKYSKKYSTYTGFSAINTIQRCEEAEAYQQ